MVGIITATEIFSMAAQLIGAWDSYSGVTLQATAANPEEIKRIASMVDGTGARFQPIYPISKEGEKHQRIVVRFETDSLDGLVEIFENEGFAVLEKVFRGEPVENLNDIRP